MSNVCVCHASKQIKTTQGSILCENGKDESFVNNFHWAGDLKKRGGIPYPITVYINNVLTVNEDRRISSTQMIFALFPISIFKAFLICN